jgi:hypothetical protein
MSERTESVGGLGIADGSFAGWRMVASAWVVAIVAIMLFIGVQALAPRHNVVPREDSFAGAVIPRHDPNCARLDAAATVEASSCPADVETGIERAEASYYGW